MESMFEVQNDGTVNLCGFLVFIYLYSIFLYLQIEDAMLMFDKQTNRHRGELAILG